MFKARKYLLELLLLAAALATAIAAFAAVPAGAAEEKMTMRNRWQVEADYPKFDDEKVDEAVREWLNKLIADIMDSVKEYADVAFTERETYFDIGISYETSRPSDKAVSILFSIFTYPSGAAHPSTGTESLNFLVGDPAPLKLDDLFADPKRALEIMSDNAKPLVREYLAASADGISEKDIAELLDGEWFREGSAPNRDNYSTLVLDPQGVRVHFQQYQVVPYAFGMPEFLVTLDKLAPAGPSEKVWPKTKE